MKEGVSGTDLEDEIVAEYDLITADNMECKEELFLLQYILRPQHKPYGDQGELSEVQLNGEENKLRFIYTLNKESENYDKYAAAHKIEQHVLDSEHVFPNTRYMIGMLRPKNSIVITPLKSCLQLRPSFAHVDIEAQKRKIKTKEEMEEEGKRKGETKVRMQLRNVEDILPIEDHYQTLLKNISLKYNPLDYYYINSPESQEIINMLWPIPDTYSSAQTIAAQTLGDTGRILTIAKNEFIDRLTKDCALQAFNPEKFNIINHKPSMINLKMLPIKHLIETLFTQFSSVLGINFILQLLSDLKYDKNELFENMFKYTIHVNYGIFALKSDIKYEKGEEKCECRDLILAKFHKYISLSKKELISEFTFKREDIEEILKELGEVKQGNWYLKGWNNRDINYLKATEEYSNITNFSSEYFDKILSKYEDLPELMRDQSKKDNKPKRGKGKKNVKLEESKGDYLGEGMQVDHSMDNYLAIIDSKVTEIFDANDIMDFNAILLELQKEINNLENPKVTLAGSLARLCNECRNIYFLKNTNNPNFDQIRVHLIECFREQESWKKNLLKKRIQDKLEWNITENIFTKALKSIASAHKGGIWKIKILE